MDCGENEIGNLKVAKHKHSYNVTISSSSPKLEKNYPPIVIVVVHGMLYFLCQLYFVIMLNIFGLWKDPKQVPYYIYFDISLVLYILVTHVAIT